MQQKTIRLPQLFRKPFLVVFFAFAVSSLLAILALATAPVANAVTPTLNFQARLLTSSGAVVPDGNYNVEFKIYSGASCAPTTGTGCTADWTEDYFGGSTDNRIRVADGYLTANLGSLTSFNTSIPWGQPLWLSLNIGGTTNTSTPGMDGAMSPYLSLTSVPSAMALDYTDGSHAGSLAFTSTLTGNDSITLPDASGTVCLATSSGGNCSTQGTGYILNQSTSPGTAQTGNFNLTGTGIANTLQVAGSGSIDTSAAGAGILNIGTTNATGVTIGSTSETGTITLGQATGSNTITIGSAVTGSATQTINIGTNTSTSTSTSLTLGSEVSTSSTAIRGGTSGITLQASAGGGTTINSLQPTSSTTAGSNASTVLTVNGATGGNTTGSGYTAGTGGGIVLQAGNGGTALSGSINGSGGSITLSAGAAGAGAGSAGSAGSVIVKNQVNSTTAFQIQNTTSSQLLNVDTTNNIISVDSGVAGQLGSNSAGDWQTTTALGAAVAHQGVVEANGYVYVVGGGVTTVKYNTVNANGTLGTWATTSSLPQQIYAGEVVVANGYIYDIGGSYGGTWSNQTFYAHINSDGTLGSWQTAPTADNLPVALRFMTGGVANGYVYVVGGVTSGGSAVNTIYYAKLLSGGGIGPWTTNATTTAANYNNSAVIANGYIYSFGGYAGSSDYYYAQLNSNGSTGSWSSVNAGTSLFQYNQAFASDGYVYVVGGWNGTTNVTNIEQAPLGSGGALGSWSTASSSLPTVSTGGKSGGIGESQAVVANGYVYLIAGLGADGLTATTTSYYISLPRTEVAGSLDLVGLEGGNLSSGASQSLGSIGGSLSAGNTNIVGTLQVQDEADFNQSLSVNGSLTATSDATFADTSNSATAFQVQSNSGYDELTVDTINNQLILGTASHVSGELTLENASNAYGVSISTSSTQANALAITIPVDSNTTDTICLKTAQNCNNAGTGNYYLVQVPTNNTGSGTASDDIIAPTTSSIVALTVNGTTGTAATALNINQGGAAVGLAISSSSNTATNAVSLTGTFTNLINASNFNVSNAGVITVAGNQTQDITTSSGASANNLTIAPGSSSTNSSSGANLVLQGGGESGTSSTGGSVSIDGGVGTANGSVSIAVINSGNVTIGSTTETGTITLGQSTGTNTINIGSSANASHTQTINLGTSSAGTSNVTIGAASGAAAGTTTIQSVGTLALGNALSSTINIQSAASGNINIGNNAVANTIQIGATTGAVAQTIGIGNNATTGSTDNVTIGSLLGTSTTTIQAGSGGISLGQNTLVSNKEFEVSNASDAQAFYVTTGTSNIFTVDTTNSRVIIGSTTFCASARFCVDQVSSTGGGSTLTTNSNVTTLATGVANSTTAMAQSFSLNDTTSNTSDALQGIVLNSTGTTNANTTITSIQANTVAANSGYLLQLEGGGTNEFTVSNSGATLIQPSSNSTSLSVEQNNSGSFGQDIFDVQGSSGGTNNFIQITSTAANAGAVNINSLGANNGVSIKSASASSGSTGSISLATGAQTGSSLQSGNISILTGNAAGGTNASSGSITIDSGTKSGSGVAGTINIGTSSSTGINVGNSASIVTIKGSFINTGTTSYSVDNSQSFSANGSVGNINSYSALVITATSSGLTLTLPDPSPTTAGKTLYISNNSSGSNLFTLSPTHGVSMPLNTGATTTLLWNGSAWTYAGADASSILNQNATAQTGNFSITGTGTVGTSLQAPILDTASAATLYLGTSSSGTGNASAITIGSTTETGTITLGQSTGTNTIDVGYGATTGGNTQAINIGTQGASGSTTVLTLGSAQSADTTKLQAGATIEQLTNTGDTVNSTSGSAFRVQNTSNANFLVVDTVTNDTNAALTVGNTTSGNTQQGIQGSSYSGIAIEGNSTSGTAIDGQSNSNDGVFGYSAGGTGGQGYGVHGSSYNGTSGYFQSSDSSNNSYATFEVQQQGSATANLIQVMNGAGSTNLLTIGSSGATAIQASNATGSALSVNQQYGSASGTVLSVQNAGTGDILDLIAGSSTVAKFNSSGATTFQNSANSANAFEVQDTGNNQLINVNTSADSVTIGSSTNGVVFTAGTFEPILNGTARHSDNITLTPEYAGATMTASGTNNSGTMTSDNMTTSPFRSYYEWQTTQSTAQNYDIWVRVPVPSNFSGFASGQTICLDTYASATTANTVKMTMYDTTNTQVVSNDLTPTATTTWQTVCTSAITSGTYTSNGIMTLDIKMTAPALTGDVRIGNVSFNYLAKW